MNIVEGYEIMLWHIFFVTAFDFWGQEAELKATMCMIFYCRNSFYLIYNTLELG
jgi:hypothetical protein